MGGLNLPLGQTHWKICLPKKVIEDFLDIHFAVIWFRTGLLILI